MGVQDATAVNDLVLAAVTAMIGEQKDAQEVLGEAVIMLQEHHETLQDMRTAIQDSRSMVVRDEIIGGVLWEPKPALKPIPEARSL